LRVATRNFHLVAIETAVVAALASFEDQTARSGQALVIEDLAEELGVSASALSNT